MTYRRTGLRFTFLHLTLLVALLLSAIPWGGAQAAPPTSVRAQAASGALYMPLPLKTVAYSPPARPLAVGTYGPVSYSSSKIPAEGKFVTRGAIGLGESNLEIYNEQCAHKPGVTFDWNDSSPAVVLMSDYLGTGPGCVASYSFEHYFKDTYRHGRNDDYTVLDKLDISYMASTGTFGLHVQDVWEVLPNNPPSSFEGAWEVEEPIPSRASTLITYTHDAGGLPTHDAEDNPLNLAYNGCFDSANGWGEWDYGYYPSSTSNASFWAHGFGYNRDGAWILRNYSRVFQRLTGLEPDTEYGLSFYAYHPYVAGDYARLDVIGRMVNGVPDSNYVYSNVTLTQNDAWEQVAVRARTDAQGTLYVGIEVGISDADWLAIDDLMIWADPDENVDPVEGDCGSANCDLLSNGPIDVEVSQRHLNLTSEGWPTPNPIGVTMTVDLEDEDFPDPWRGGYLQLSVKNLYDGPTRVFAVPWNGESPLRFHLGREESMETIPGVSYEFYDDTGAYYHLAKVDGLPTYDGIHEEYYWQIWVQPSDAAKLEIKAELVYNEDYPVTDPPNLWDRTCVQVPQAQIHPVVFVHGILGSMPPGDHVWAEHPPLNWDVLNSYEPVLDPFVRSYYPLLQNLEKMGYEWGKTLHAVTYNWLNSNSQSGGYLASQLPGIIGAAAGVDYVNQDGRSDIVVHSMGGLVTRAYVEGKATQPYAGDLNRAVFIASPHEGFAVTYNTWEGMTWEDYLDTEVLVGADFKLMTELMDNVVWPSIVVDRYRPSEEEFTASCAEGLFPIIGPGLVDPICNPEALYAWSHTEGARGVQSLPQMLPTQDLIATYGRYLVDVNDPQAELPYEANTWLEDLNSDVSLLNGRLDDIFVVYGDGKRTVVNYTVEPPPQGYQGMWQYGEKVQSINDTTGDNLILARSTNLELVGTGPSILYADAYSGKDAGHKALPYKTEVQQDVGGFLGGYRIGDEIADIPFFTPYNSTIAPGNLVRVYFLASWLMPPYRDDSEVGLSGNQFLTDSQGRRVGYDSDSGQIINEIPGAYVLGDEGFGARFFILTDPIAGHYALTSSGVATYTENYAVMASDIYLDGAGGVRTRSLGGFTDTLTTGQVITTPLFVPSLGAVGQWNMDEVSGTLAYDSSGYEHHGQLAGGPTWTGGQQGGALRLDGLDDHVWISDSASLEVSGTLTLEAWVYPESLAGEQVLFSRWQDGQRAYELTLDQGRLRARLSGDGVNAVDLGAATLTATLGSWQHLALVYDGASAYYYVDGVGQETPVAPPAGSVFSGTAPLFLGRSTDLSSTALSFAGLLDEVRILDVARDNLYAWQQSDWSGGPGQTAWNGGDSTRYATATGVDVSSPGEIHLTGSIISDTMTYSVTGVLTSSVFEASQPLTWTLATWEAEQPSGVEAVLAVATSDDGLNWSDWATLEGEVSGDHYQADLSLVAPALYLRYKVTLMADPLQSISPTLRDIAFKAYLSPQE